MHVGMQEILESLCRRMHAIKVRGEHESHSRGWDGEVERCLGAEDEIDWAARRKKDRCTNPTRAMKSTR